MSSIVVAGDTSGTITISAPAVSGSSVLTLPVATDTLAGIAATQTLTNKTLVAPALGTPASGVLTNCTGVVSGALPAGCVLQAVSAAQSVGASNSTSTYTDTGLTATITPRSVSSKVLVMVSHNGVSKNISGTASGVNLRLLNGASVISTFATNVGYTNVSSYNVGFSVGVNYLDSPGVTSAVTYKTQFANGSNVASVEVGANSAISYITLMEIQG